MSILQEKTTRRLLKIMFLLFSLNLFLDVRSAWNQTHRTQELLLAQSRAIASSLLDAGISEETVCKALTNTDTSSEGIHLLAKLGLHEHTSPRFFPGLSACETPRLLFALRIPLLIFLLLFAAILRYLFLQNRLYLRAIETISAYTAGSFDTLLPQTEEGTLYRLFGSINHMAAALKAGQETEHQTKEFLKNTISDIYHQLKTPLAALSMYNEILLNEPDHADTVQAFAQKSEAAINRMKTLILSLLKIARLDAGTIHFQKSLCPLSKLLQDALEPLSWRLLPEKKQIHLPQIPTGDLYCDPDWTKEALQNILKNALDHTGEGALITLKVEQDPLETRIHILDNGPGIPPSDLYHIFKRFYRSPGSKTSGTGLGLPLAKAIIEGQEGTLTAQSPKDSGAVFTLSLPTLQNRKPPFTQL